MANFFKTVTSFFEDFLFIPLDTLRQLELSNWWLANTITWVMIIVLLSFLFYWVKQLISFDRKKEERTDIVSHSFFKK